MLHLPSNLIFANRFITWWKYLCIYNPRSLEMQRQCAKLALLFQTGHGCSLRSWRRGSWCPARVWILGAYEQKASSSGKGGGVPAESQRLEHQNAFWCPCLENYWLTCCAMLWNWFWVSAKFFSCTAVAFRYFTVTHSKKYILHHDPASILK